MPPLPHLEVAGHPLAYQQHLAMAQMQRGCDKNIRATLNKYEKMIDAETDMDQDFHWHKMSLGKLQEAHNRGKHRSNEGIIQLNQALDSFFIENKLLLSLEMANRKNIISEESAESTLSIPWELIENELNNQSLGTRILYQIYQMITQEESLPYVDAVEQLLYANHQKLEINFKQTIVGYLKNNAIRKVNQGNLAYGKRYIEYIQFQQDNDFFLEKETISPSRFQNIVIIALRVGEVDWGLAFAKKYMNKLPALNREKYVGLTLANIYFYQNKYKLAYRNLQVFHRTQFTQHILSERLRMKILFEQKEYEELNMAAQNFMRFVRTHKQLPKGYKLPLKLFAKYLNQLAKYQHFTPQKVLKLRKKVEAEPHIFDKEWLLRKINEGSLR